MSSVPSLAAVTDPPLRLMDAAAMDYFTIEMVNALRVSSAVATARAKKIEREMMDSGLLPAPPPGPPALKKGGMRQSTSTSASHTSAGGNDGEEELRTRLESIGMHVGANIAERYL